jgi:hypothetical protein
VSKKNTNIEEHIKALGSNIQSAEELEELTRLLHTKNRVREQEKLEKNWVREQYFLILESIVL